MIQLTLGTKLQIGKRFFTIFGYQPSLWGGVDEVLLLNNKGKTKKIKATLLTRIAKDIDQKD
ncbi:MAG: hypothetical protein PHV08_08075 [Sulfurovaceae bacterium]|nr:hypothetical protein [Sulfurovaceae bacterium]